MPPKHHTTSQTQKGQQKQAFTLSAHTRYQVHRQNEILSKTNAIQAQNLKKQDTTLNDAFFWNFEHKIITDYYPIEKADLKKHKCREAKVTRLVY
jgi:hypothetical protein